MKITLAKAASISTLIAITGAALVYVATLAGDTRWVTIASTEKALLREYRLDALDLEYLRRKGEITEREQLRLDQLQIDIDELKDDLGYD